MAINTRKISGLSELTELSGEEYLMVAKDGRSYKMKTNVLTSDIITSIDQAVVSGDEKENPIVIKTSAGDVYRFSIRNGAKGSKGERGDDGAPGQSGNTELPIYPVNTDPRELIIDTLNDTEHTDSELSTYMLSAKQGAILNTKLDKLREVYCTQEEYDKLVDDDKISTDTKYFIVEE